MNGDKDKGTELEIELARLKSHERHMRYIYGVRLAALAIATLTIIIGAVMIFMGLQGSFNWAFEAPHTIGAKLTNASPGIVFATIGLIVIFCVVLQAPVDYTTGPEFRSGRLGFRERLREGFEREVRTARRLVGRKRRPGG